MTPAPTTLQHRPALGIGLKLASVLIFIVMSAMIKAAAEHVPAGETVFFRSFFAVPVILVWLAWRGELATGLRVARPMGHVWRGVAGTGRPAGASERLRTKCPSRRTPSAQVISTRSAPSVEEVRVMRSVQ